MVKHLPTRGLKALDEMQVLNKWSGEGKCFGCYYFLSVTNEATEQTLKEPE